MASQSLFGQLPYIPYLTIACLRCAGGLGRSKSAPARKFTIRISPAAVAAPAQAAAAAPDGNISEGSNSESVTVR